MSKVNNSVAVAENMYHTIRLASDFLQLVDDELAVITQLSHFVTPDVAVIHDEALQRQFARISDRINWGL